MAVTIIVMGVLCPAPLRFMVLAWPEVAEVPFTVIVVAVSWRKGVMSTLKTVLVTSTV